MNSEFGQPHNQSQDSLNCAEGVMHPSDLTMLPTGGKILFASKTPDWSISAMLKADEFARLLDAELLVLQVSQPGQPPQGLFKRDRMPAAIRALERWGRAQAAAIERCNQILPGEISAERLRVREGDFVHEVVRAVEVSGAELVVMQPQKKGNGRVAMDIARAAKIPVLIARPPRSHNIVVAATNLADRRYPVLRQANRVGSRLGAQMVVIHNVSPIHLPGGLESGGSLPIALNPQDAAKSQEQLFNVARQYSNCAATLWKNQFSTSGAILETARAFDADLIVVGVKETSFIERLLGGSVASRVAEQALRSVLITPMTVHAGAHSSGRDPGDAGQFVAQPA